MDQIRKGEDLDNKALKAALSFVNLCGNMTDIRHELTMAAMSFVRSLTNDEYNVNYTLRKKSKFTTTTEGNSSGGGGDDKEEEVIEPKRMRIESEVINKKTATMKHELTSSVNVNENFKLDNFVQVLVDDDDFFLPEFEIREGGTEDTKPLDE